MDFPNNSIIQNLNLTPKRKKVQLRVELKWEICLFWIEHSKVSNPIKQDQVRVFFGNKYNVVSATFTNEQVQEEEKERPQFCAERIPKLNQCQAIKCLDKVQAYCQSFSSWNLSFLIILPQWWNLLKKMVTKILYKNHYYNILSV